jgi:hypothetical protein
MTARSQNGWPVLDTAPAAVEIPGTGIRVTVRPGDVAAVLTHLASRFHRDVERLDHAVRESPGRDDWGWAHRPVRGQSTGYSNHASGTAIDLNATRHPRGVRGTFTRAQIAAVRRILADLVDPATGRPVVRWGEDYTKTVDGMHFEINADAEAVARTAAAVRTRSQEDDVLKLDDVIDLGRGQAAVLGEPDHEITVEQALAIVTAALVEIQRGQVRLQQSIDALTTELRTAARRET